VSESFLSNSWYRVAELRPRLKTQARLYRHRYRGRPWYVLHDRATGRSHRFTPAAYLFLARLDGHHTVDAIWTDIAAELDEEAPTQDEVIQLLAQLHSADLLQSDTLPDAEELFQRFRKQSRQTLLQNLKNPMSLKLPLWDPNGFLERTIPFVRPFIGWPGFLLWCAVVLPAVVLAGINWTALTENVSDRVLSANNLLLMTLVYPVVKALHELGHGYVCKRYGGEVREMGLMFLVLFPVPYVDASAATAFRSKWERAAVGAAGILAESFLAALALYAWLLMEPGTARAVAYNVMLIGGFSTLIVNGNPLLRFDGYYVFSDLVESPNLGPRSNEYFAYVVQRDILKAEGLKQMASTPGEQRLFMIYAPVSYIYRIVVMFSISLFIATRFFFVGIILGAWTLINSLVIPFFKALRFVHQDGKLRRVRDRAYGVTYGGLAVLAILLFAIPAPMRLQAEGVVWVPEEAIVRAGSDGFVRRVLAEVGNSVQRGTPLVELEEPVLAARIEATTSEVRSLRLALAEQQVDDPSAAVIARVALEEAESRLARDQRQAGRMKLDAGVDGRFTLVANPGDIVGRFFKEGEIVGYVTPPRASVVRVVVSQNDIELVRERLKAVRIRLADRMGETLPSHVLRQIPGGVLKLPSAALGSMGGGRIAVDPRDSNGLTALDRVFQFDVALPDNLEQPPFGARVHVRFSHFWEPLGQQIYRRVRQLLLRQFGT